MKTTNSEINFDCRKVSKETTCNFVHDENSHSMSKMMCNQLRRTSDLTYIKWRNNF